MADQQSGLRFDIYERVHLSEGVAGIKELEGVELVPHIQVLPQGDQALLRGNLLLSGTYVDEQDAFNRTLEHLIPVEITLPMNRVQRMEDIAVEIENFDVELLSTRSLNITGVLSLNGLEVVSAASADSWGEEEEEVVFVHEAREQAPEEAQRFEEALQEEEPPFEQEPGFAEEAAFAQGETAEPSGAERTEASGFAAQPSANQQQWSSPPSSYAAANPIPEPKGSPAAERSNRSESWSAAESGSLSAVKESEQAADAEAAQNQSLEAAEANEPNEQSEQNEPLQPLSQQEDKKEMKIAFSGKKTESAESSKSAGLSSLLQNAVSSKGETRPEEEAPAAAPPTGDKLEWKRLLGGPRQEQQEFKRLRLCIVQKEETLETIAKRYDLNPREIALFNRLGENDLSEGQIVYIPK
ncbi:LysM peptidoglycan-binding domain-containing protein [Paenibacillus doosanensis]|uniref:Stage VI sporulation protein D n=1 Tax=Paenibacillus konkukensis TaxID=2020716 RepID=A0ABY4RXK9_9BACL|nr:MULTISPECIES: LysM peptidoglycan-binding domain-containing protein [Paenibacillus]MCS7458737.1 LysM peptidoglycan-binding domain-containing protein [Paenibacillus doosanensis]UQZ86738.1 Stage VI sporulation protein D [Paenibacillus konkukensis]